MEHWGSDNYPYLERDDILEALGYAARVFDREGG
jgi:uncharacterized protein (DUF433 family)